MVYPYDFLRVPEPKPKRYNVEGARVRLTPAFPLTLWQTVRIMGKLDGLDRTSGRRYKLACKDGAGRNWIVANIFRPLDIPATDEAIAKVEEYLNSN